MASWRKSGCIYVHQLLQYLKLWIFPKNLFFFSYISPSQHRLFTNEVIYLVLETQLHRWIKIDFLYII